MMSRLTNNVRETMAKALVRHKLSCRADALIAESVALFKAVYADLYDPALQKTMAALQKRGKAFKTDNDLTVNVRGSRISVGAISFGGNELRWKSETELLPFFWEHLEYNAISYSEGALCDRIDAFGDARKQFDTDANEAYRKALGTLGQFATGKKLAADWPEAMPIIGSLIPEENRTLPVIQLAAINADFGLPPADRIAA